MKNQRCFDVTVTFECAAEHKNSAIGKPFYEVHSRSNLLNESHFNILRKLHGKLDC